MMPFKRWRPALTPLLSVVAWVVVATAVVLSNFGERGYRTLDGGRLVLSPAGQISVYAAPQAGGYDLCAAKSKRLPSQQGQYVPTIQDALHLFCPGEADVQRAGLERPEWFFSFHAAGRATAAERRTVTALLLAESLVIVGGAFSFVVLLRRLRARPFAGDGVVWLRLCALAVAIGGVGLPLLVHRFELSLLERLSVRVPDVSGDGVRSLDPVGSVPGVAPYVVVVVLVVFAQVWQSGIRLREDAEATI